MSTPSYAVSDSATMLRRNLRHALPYPGMTVAVLGMPIIMLLLFVYVFGGAMSAGLAGASNGGTRYIDYVVPGIILMAVSSGSVSTAVAISVDMTEGIIARFRTMAIARVSVLTGNVVGSMVQTAISTTLVVGVALLMGFRPTAGPVEWLAVVGVVAMVTLALTWLAVAIGLVTKSPEIASNAALPLQFLPFIGSAFVPPDSMPTGVRWFAENQPFTPIIETLRGLLTGTPIGNRAIIAVAWCVGIALVGYLWARAAYNRDPAP